MGQVYLSHIIYPRLYILLFWANWSFCWSAICSCSHSSISNPVRTHIKYIFSHPLCAPCLFDHRHVITCTHASIIDQKNCFSKFHGSAWPMNSLCPLALEKYSIILAQGSHGSCSMSQYFFQMVYAMVSEWFIFFWRRASWIGTPKSIYLAARFAAAFALGGCSSLAGAAFALAFTLAFGAAFPATHLAFGSGIALERASIDKVSCALSTQAQGQCLIYFI